MAAGLFNPPPSLALSDVPGFPAEVAAALADQYGIRTLADLRPLVEAAAAKDDKCEPAFKVLYDLGLDFPDLGGRAESTAPLRFRAGEALLKALGGRVHMLKVMAAWPAGKPAARPATHEPAAKPVKTQPCGCPVEVRGLKGAHEPGCPYVADAVRTGDTMERWAKRQKPADDFDENTPPPRARPKGDPIPRYAVMPPGESPVAAFWGWDRAGRIPPGAVLAEFVGTDCGSHSGYRVVANSEAHPGKFNTPLGEPGSLIPSEKLDEYDIATTVVEQVKAGRRTLVVLAPHGKVAEVARG